MEKRIFMKGRKSLKGVKLEIERAREGDWNQTLHTNLIWMVNQQILMKCVHPFSLSCWAQSNPLPFIFNPVVSLFDGLVEITMHPVTHTHTRTHSTRYNWILETTLKNGRNELRRQQEFNYIFDSVRHYLIGIDYLVAGIGLARVQLDDKLAESCQSCLHISRFDGIAWLDLIVFEQRHRILLGLCAC